MRLLIICPIPIEFNSCREILALRDTRTLSGCKTGRSASGNCEIIAIESGPAKVRAACATVSGCIHFSPDLIIDSGSCSGIEPGSIVGEIIMSERCYECDISGNGFPVKIIPEMKLFSGFNLLQPAVREALQREAVEEGRSAGFPVHVGDQACGEFLIQSLSMREELFSIFHASGFNWETAGVFIGALKNLLPPLSIRVITDLGNENALKDFRKNVKQRSKDLYRYIQMLIETGWFDRFIGQWQQVDYEVINKLPCSVLP